MVKQITRAELKERYEKTSVRRLAAEMNVTIPGLYKLLDQCGIQRKGHPTERTKYAVIE